MFNEFNYPGTDVQGLRIGALVSLHHGVGGVVYALNETALLVKDFTYDGAGPDAFFWAGTGEEKKRERWRD